MKHLISVIILFSLFIGISIAQETTIDNHVWQHINRGEYSFRLPPDWSGFGDIWQHLDNLSTLTFRSGESIDTIISQNLTLITEEMISLPIGESQKITSQNENIVVIVYAYSDLDQTIALIGRYNKDLTDTEQGEMNLIFEQAANTLKSHTMAWIPYTNTTANLFLMIPPNWTRESADDDSLTVSEIFSDVSIAIRYRDLGRSFELQEIEEQFTTIYNSSSYDIQAQEIMNLPSGNALFFQLGNVRVTSDSTQTQWHYVIARDNYMIVLVAGADEDYFTQYESLFSQIVDTISFVAP